MLYIGPQSATSPVDQLNIQIPSDTLKGSVDIDCGFYNRVFFQSGGFEDYGIFPGVNRVTISVE